MAKTLSSIVIATDTFSTLITRTNQVITALGQEIVTANSSVDGANTTGNTNLIGIFGANTIAVGTALRGGTVNSAANLVVSSNTSFTGSNTSFSSNLVITNAVTAINATSTTFNGPTVTIGSNTSVTGNLVISGAQLSVSSNIVFTGSNTTVQSNSYSVTSNTFSVVGNNFIVNAAAVTYNTNVTSNGTLTVLGNLTSNADIVFGTFGKIVNIANAGIGATTGSPITVYSWPKANFEGAQLLTKTANSTTTRTSTIVVATNGTDAFMTEYATVHAPSGSNLGIFTVSTDASSVIMRFTQNSPDTSVSLHVTLLA